MACFILPINVFENNTIRISFFSPIRVRKKIWLISREKPVLYLAFICYWIFNIKKNLVTSSTWFVKTDGYDILLTKVHHIQNFWTRIRPGPGPGVPDGLYPPVGHSRLAVFIYDLFFYLSSITLWFCYAQKVASS